MDTHDKIEIRMRDTFPGLGTVTWSEMVWSHPIPAAELDLAPPGIRNAAGGRPGHTVRMLDNICFGVPLVCGDLVETAPVRPEHRYPQVTRVVSMQEGILVTATGYAGISREGTGIPVGPGANDMVCGCGYCDGPGLDERWWRACRTGLVERGAHFVETDGDRIVVFFPQAPGASLDRVDVTERCCSVGMVRDTLRLHDRADREVFSGLRLVGCGEPGDGFDAEPGAEPGDGGAAA
ncbi:hypothetical protein [uncultured Corynebacterium sp.]|uniref:hypothetical protein n=1 Tax=uncultured Corynebacterium sp. TaxID=159447 RepID=UPI0025DA96D3|nr:hypothetical protein [uncultured Corynebacterium sp.]